MINSLIKKLSNADIVFLVIYLLILHFLVIRVNLPPVKTQSIIISLFIFLTTTLAGLFFSKKINHFFEIKISNLNKTLDTEFLKTTVHLIAFISGLFILISIFISMYHHKDIIYSQGGFGLRAISTSLHKLVPLETRWIYLFGPWVFFLKPESQSIKIIKVLNIIFWISLIILTQTKLNYILVIFICSAYYSVELFRQFSKIKLLILFSIILSSYLALNFLILKTGSGEQVVLSNQKIVNLNLVNDWENTPVTNYCNSFLPEATNQPKVVEERKYSISFSDFLMNIHGRVFGVSQRATGAYYCLRDYANWRPHFRGHQLARLLGVYKPVNRWVMQNMDPLHGSTAVTSAVANFVSDAYLNEGFIGVFFASLLSILGWLFLSLMSNSGSSQAIYFLYLRYLFCLILITQSFISALVIILFVFLIYYISLWGKKLSLNKFFT